MGRRNRAAQLPINLPQLQNLIKRDPPSYKEDFAQQYRHFESQLAIFKLNPNEEAEDFGNLVTFISQVSQCYPQETGAFPQIIIDLLLENYQIIHPDLRKTLVQALILLRNKDIVPSSSLLSLFFILFRARDKQLRDSLYTYIINDIKIANAKHKNNKLNKTLQSYMYTVLQSTTSIQSDRNYNDNISIISNQKSTGMSEDTIVAKKSLDVCIELYRKGVWNDAKTVNVIAEGCFHITTKIKVAAIQFFLDTNRDSDDNSSDSDEGEVPDIKRLQHINSINKKKKSKTRKMVKALALVKKKAKQKHKAESFNFSALHLLNDPQGFAEKLFSSLQKSSNNDRFEVKLMTMNLISRIIGVHKLTLLNFYSYLMRYLQPHQREVTMILVIVAQASHELIPPDTLEPVVKAIANNFVSDHCAGEVMAAGLNAIREICHRQPLALDIALLQDLTEYKSDKDKSIMIAARSLIGLYREINPEMLQRKDRGKAISMNIKKFKPLQYGEVRATDHVDGIELLEDFREKQEKTGVLENEWAEWEIASESSSDGEWIDVSSEDEKDIIICDSSGEDEAVNNRDFPNVVPHKEDADLEKIDLNDIEGIVKSLHQKKEEEPKTSTLDMQRLLTPADFVKIEQLKLERNAQKLVGKRKRDACLPEQKDLSEIIDANQITGQRKKAKQDYEERLESIKAGREGREKYGSFKTKKQEGASATNRETARKKPFMMVVHKKNFLCKKKPSLREKQMQLTNRRGKQKSRRK
ncbi:hypothetical protein G9A89_009080 [Geosiphon pyriformis]|nr:hypothetical protein G9A89_009080 [Geosiphon pyriformis]